MRSTIFFLAGLTLGLVVVSPVWWAASKRAAEFERMLGESEATVDMLTKKNAERWRNNLLARIELKAMLNEGKSAQDITARAMQLVDGEKANPPQSVLDKVKGL